VLQLPAGVPAAGDRHDPVGVRVDFESVSGGVGLQPGQIGLDGLDAVGGPAGGVGDHQCLVAVGVQILSGALDRRPGRGGGLAAPGGEARQRREAVGGVEGRLGALPGLLTTSTGRPVPIPVRTVQRLGCNSELNAVLLDATGTLITDVGEALSALAEDQRPDKVIFLIMTDGMENSSRQWTWGAVKALITQQREVYNWEFIFLGADIDAVEVGARMGMDSGNAMTFDKRSYMSNRAAYRMVSDKIGRRRLASAGPLESFSDEERDEAMGRGGQPTTK
jgi:hypothetical protein